MRAYVRAMRWRRFPYLALSLSSTAFAAGLVADGFWGGTDGDTNWVDQSFGLAMWLGGFLVIVFAVMLFISLVIAGAVRGVGKRRVI
jgi:K+-transporting ATPase A subunit